MSEGLLKETMHNLLEEFNQMVKKNEHMSLLQTILVQIEENMSGQENFHAEIYADLVEQGTMQNFSLLLNRFSKNNLDLIKALLNVLLDFSAFIDPLATDNPLKPDNFIAIESFVQGNIIGRILKVIESISKEFQQLVQVKN